MAKPILLRAARICGYDTTHLTRVVAYREVDAFLDTLGTENLDALEISAGWKWRERTWRSFDEMNWPDHDICSDRLDRQYDVIIADNVFEHLRYPHRAACNVHSMLRPGGYFINITPFLIRRHTVPIDCTRWTETGMLHFLEEAGFDPELIRTGSWGNVGAVKANLRRWARRGWKRRLANDPDFPITVWAIARRP